jgi:hypothetical protein
MAAIDIKQTIGLDKINLGFGSNYINIILMVLIVAVVLILVAGVVLLWLNNKKYKFKIPLYAFVGNTVTRVAFVKAKPVNFGMAGDVLWFCKGKGIKKWIAPATIQSAPNEFWHYLRSDGEWINFSMDDLNEKSRTMGVKFVAQDMRMQRLANEKLLELKFSKQGFWEKWGVIIGYVIFFLVITISLVIYFYQLNGVMQKMSEVVGQVNTLLERANVVSGGSPLPDGTPTGLVPAFIPLLIFKLKRKWSKKIG